MRIAVIGGGVCGLAFCYFYQKKNPTHQITLFDPKPIGEGTSSLAHLMNPFIGRRAKLNWKGYESFEKSHLLLSEASNYSKEKFFQATPLLRLATNLYHEKFLKRAASSYPSISWQEKTDYKFPGVMVEQNIQVNTSLYLRTLFTILKNKGLMFQSKRFDFSQQNEFDKLIISVGSGLKLFKEFSELSFSHIKGQILKVRWPSESFSLPYPVAAPKVNLIPSLDKQFIFICSTYERDYENEKPSLSKAKKLLLPHLESWMPLLSESLDAEVFSGIRLNAPNRLPIVSPFSEKVWLFVGMGSKGLLYHAYLGEKLANAVSSNDLRDLPEDVLLKDAHLKLSPLQNFKGF